MRTTVATKLGIVFGLSLVILVVIGSVAFYDTRNLVAVTAARAQARQFLWDLEQLVANLGGAENEQRGYLLTGDPSYRIAYQKSTASLAPVFADLKVKDPALRARVEALEPLIAAAIHELDHGIALRDKNGMQAAIADSPTPPAASPRQWSRSTSTPGPSATSSVASSASWKRCRAHRVQ